MIPRKAIAGLTLSAAALVGIVLEEHYTDKAIIPTKGDRWTLGHGSTFHEDGTPVKEGDTTTPVRALVKMQAHITKEEKSFVASMPDAYLHPGEFDLYMKWTYQFGTGNWWNSSMRRNILAGSYTAACDSLLAYKYSAGYDCSTLINGKPNKRCYGVWTRQLERHKQCLALQ
ncbi:MAG: hypothetical protein WC829_09880 [Hyphomicrobium sp.]|jgi:GH24 family phage-related lysozyme (muramidase)